MGLIDDLNSSLPANWSIASSIAGGGQGTVYSGEYFGNPSAIKLFRVTSDQRRIDAEIQLLKSLTSDRLVRVLGSTRFKHQGSEMSAVAYEHIAGGTIEILLKPTTKTDTATVAQVGHDISEAVELLWRKRVVHRDIKPANIMIAANMRYVLVDFGFARHLDLSDMTQPGGNPGTSGFKSPEQAAGRRSLTISSDIFSLGVTLFCVAARNHPYRGMQPLASSKPIGLLESYRPDLPKPLCRLVMRMLAPVPSSRPRSPRDEFARILKGTP